PFDAERIHGISTDLAQEQGIVLSEGLSLFNKALKKTQFIVGQNVNFDINILGCEFYRLGIESQLTELPVLDTCTEHTATLCKIPGGRGGRFKLPTLSELHNFLFGIDFKEAHNATADVEATTRCFLELIRLGHYTVKQLKLSENYLHKYTEVNTQPIKAVGLKHINLKEESDKIRKKKSAETQSLSTHSTTEGLIALKNVSFAHLHNHTQFSVLQSTTDIEGLVRATAKMGMPAVALTDTGNMMAAFRFVDKVLNYNKTAKNPIKPIVGCEFFVCTKHSDKSKKDNGYQVVLLAKNKKGYHNLVKMASIAYSSGFYYVPRIDREVIVKYKEDIIALTGNLYGEVPSKILNIGKEQAEKALLWWKEQFADDLYIELMRHSQEDEKVVNATLLDFSKKHNIKIIATNNTYYLHKDDADAHDILLCVKDGEKQATPKGKGRGHRYGLFNKEYYFKSPDQMKELFADIPEAIINIQELIDKVKVYSLAREVLLPAFDIPEKYQDPADKQDGGKRGENNYLRALTYKGATKRYKKVTDAICKRLDFELEVIANTGYPGYFLIVQDLIKAARKMGVSVGPGRGSAAGSAVAYCLTITNIDPIAYNLLFERFLNPERISMPDIDIDFDDRGRSKVMDYVIKKYGIHQVAQIITYGTMAAKSSIRDTARVLDLPLFEADKIAKLIPGVKLQNIFGEDQKSKAIIASLRSDEKTKVEKLQQLAKGIGLDAKTINQARVLEGSLRNTGTHACGVIITPDDITNFVPISLAKDTDMYVTQFDNSVVENAGLLKMDFLGLKTLTLIKDTVKIVKARHGIDLDPENFPDSDQKTYALFQRGETIGVFQYESVGMQKYMRELKPTVFADLIAMNALYRPGPLEYIPSFIRRKHGSEPITYDLSVMEEYLSETYGITVYQEQVMQLSQKLADFSKGQADILRKAMGKKQIAVLEKMKPKFIEQAVAKGHDKIKLEKIWKDWQAFASYAFNKSHATCYAWVAYQTAYLKAHYPAEYMAAVLSNNMNDVKQVSFFMEECKRMGLEVLGPDINESYADFSVNKQGAIRFGMAAVKGTGISAVKAIIDQRKQNGNYTSFFDVIKRVDLHTANKKAFEGLILAGAFDSFSQTHRAQYFALDEKNQIFLEKILRFGHKYQENKNSLQMSLFGENSKVSLPEPTVPLCEPWSTMELLAKEKEIIGMYISAHPLDVFKNELKFCNANLKHFKNLANYEGMTLSFAGIVTDVQHRISKMGKGWATFTIEDYNDSFEFKIFGEEYLKNKYFLVQNSFIFAKALIKPAWVNSDGVKGEPRINFIKFALLQDIMDQLCNKITLSLPLQGLKEKTINELQEIIVEHKGKQNLYFNILDSEEKIELNLHSKIAKVKVSNEFLNALDKQLITYVLN
ncbi:MAG: DNA polymerase III subunit alpha, partial [Tenacibaculum sp.]